MLLKCSDIQSNIKYSLLGNNVPSVVVCLIDNRFDYRIKQIALECHCPAGWCDVIIGNFNNWLELHMYSEGDLWIDLSLKGHVVACVLVQVGYVIRSFI